MRNYVYFSMLAEQQVVDHKGPPDSLGVVRQSHRMKHLLEATVRRNRHASAHTMQKPSNDPLL